MELEDAINFWRVRKPATGDECTLCAEAAALAGPYAAMIMNHAPAAPESSLDAAAQAALAAWRKERRPAPETTSAPSEGGNPA